MEEGDVYINFVGLYDSDRVFDISNVYGDCTVRIFVCLSSYLDNKDCDFFLDWECKSCKKKFYMDSDNFIFLCDGRTYILVEEHKSVYVQVLKNSKTGEESVGWSRDLSVISNI